MYESLNITSESPDTKHTAQFDIKGEIRYGPLYYSLAVDGHSFGQRIFGSMHLWSQSSIFLAVQEWLTLDYSEGPITALLIIDIQRKRTASVAQATKIFLIPKMFEDAVLMYQKERAGQLLAPHFMVDTTTIIDWTVLA